MRNRPLLTLPQVLLLLGLVAALIIALDLNRREQQGRLVGTGEEALAAEIAHESTRQAELKVTEAYVMSDDYVADYARNEAGYLLPGEKRVVVLPLAAPAEATPSAPPTPDPASQALPWQAWFRLLLDVPRPGR